MLFFDRVPLGNSLVGTRIAGSVLDFCFYFSVLFFARLERERVSDFLEEGRAERGVSRRVDVNYGRRKSSGTCRGKLVRFAASMVSLLLLFFLRQSIFSVFFNY